MDLDGLLTDQFLKILNLALQCRFLALAPIAPIES